jgi:hypothetical protein
MASARRLFFVAVLCAVPFAHADTDPSFVLTGTAENFGTYFPSYLANGYFSTMTSVRGTEPARGYMVAFMDYAKDDIARPAAVPGWSEIDYNPGGGWLNSTRIAPQIFADYAQTLDMYDATLTTRYRFEYANKSTDVAVKTFVSQADGHLAATQFTITPQFAGRVQLTFPIRLWSEHAPRFPIANMSGDDMIAAVIAIATRSGIPASPALRPTTATRNSSRCGSTAGRSRGRQCPRRWRSRCRKGSRSMK